ncbi:MAG TPA: MFS transporter [Amycolatopsis sp.]
MTKRSPDSPPGRTMGEAGRRVADRLDGIPVGRWHRSLVTVVGLGCFFNFFEVAVGTLMIPLLPGDWVPSTLGKSLIIGSTFAGELLGALILTPLADRVGRRRMFQLNLVSYAALALLCAFATGPGELVTLRFLIGVGLGAELALVDAYLAELLPASHRGRLVARSYAFGMLAVPLAGAAASLLPHTLAGISSWRWMLAFSALGAVVVWALRRRLPESPRWLLSRGREADAIATLLAIETRAGHVPPRDPGPVPAPRHPPSTSERPRLLRRPLLGRTMLACVIETLGPVGFYGFASIAPLVLLHKGFDVVESLSYTALTAIGYPLGSLLLIVLADRCQRRTLTIVTSLGVAIVGTVFGFAGSAWLIVVAGTATTLLSVIQATVSRTYTAELFPTSVRSTVIGRSYALSRLVAGLLPFIALTVLDVLGPAILYLSCAALITAMSVCVAFLGPRTNAVQLEEIAPSP